MSDTTARKLESAMQAALIDGLAMRQIYRASESTERVLPCVVLKATFKADDFSIKIAGRYGETLEFRAVALVPASAEDSAEALEAFAGRLLAAIEGAAITGGWNYLRFIHAGEERAFDPASRQFAHIFTVTAHPI